MRLDSSNRSAAGMLDSLYTAAIAAEGDIGAALELARGIGPTAPAPGSGRTLELWEVLATVAAADPTVARVLEPHLDALAILGALDTDLDIDADLGTDLDLGSIGADDGSTWGVFAAEAPGVVLTAALTGQRWSISGTKPWCSLADRLSHALVTAHIPDGGRRLFAVSLASAGVRTTTDGWHARGLWAVTSGPVDFDRVDAVPVGAPGWYLERPGFAWGGIGVAAVWWGAAVGIARLIDERARSREPDQIALMHLGATDAALWAARSALVTAAAAIDTAGVDTAVGADERRSTPGSVRVGAGILAARTRAIVAGAAEDVIRRAGHTLGPAPLALDARHAGRVADLELYLRQHHAERDEAALGRAILAGGSRW